jgi:hypothetical protein
MKFIKTNPDAALIGGMVVAGAGFMAASAAAFAGSHKKGFGGAVFRRGPWGFHLRVGGWDAGLGACGSAGWSCDRPRV